MRRAIINSRRIPDRVTDFRFEGKKVLKTLPQRINRTFPKKRETSRSSLVDRHTYLQVGDRVIHRSYKTWGCGIVIEAWASEVPGGRCFARIQFQDGKMRVFDNNYDSSCCCYYSGITLLNRVDL
jgi:hypothetical protein